MFTWLMVTTDKQWGRQQKS